jgi:hypothetical protein
VKVFAYLYHGMRAVSIRQLWGRAWDFFKGHWLLFVGLYVLSVIVIFISISALIFGFIALIVGSLTPFFIVSFIGFLIVQLILRPEFVRAGYLVARKGQPSFREAFGDLSLLLKIFVYDLILRLIPGLLIGMGVYRVLESTFIFTSTPHPGTEKDDWAIIVSMMLGGTGGVLIGAGLVIFFILYLFGWAGPYAILSRRAGILSAIGQSFSLTWWNFSKVFVALLSFIGLLTLGLLLLRLGFLRDVPILTLGGVLLCGLWLLVVGPMGFVFWPLLYFALTDEECVSHAKSLRLG